ncbi:MAG: TolC family protein [Roseateles sp.]|uniref:TolC family protein n=1 Tax=Roseateles sp. TaxID=1971397 RepID=UPI0039EA5933
MTARRVSPRARAARSLARGGAFALACAALSACALSALDSAPQSPSTPWVPATEAGGTAAAPGFRVPADRAVAVLIPTPGIVRDKAYSLPELIDIAQTNNPLTRVAWQQARQAALAAGMVEATYLPFISASVIGGHQKITNSLPLPIGTINKVDSDLEGISPQVALQWLVFDFGQRGALHAAAQHNATAANILFNAAHQKIIFDVTRTYALHGAALSRERIAAQALANSRRIQDAAEERMRKGLGTTVELAQANQQVAQARFALVQAQGAGHDAYQALLAAMGVSPVTTIKIREASGRPLPDTVAVPTEALITAALAQRPDVLASFSALKASQAGIFAAQAEFLPKVFLSAVAVGGNTNFSAGGLPTIGQQSSAAGVLVGATVPLYDGGLRAARLRTAESLAAASEATLDKVRDTAAREIVVGANTLRSALAAHTAATALVKAAAVTYDAALDAYTSGVGTLTAATAADSALLTARQAQADAHAASLVAAANLAFVLGDMTSREAPAPWMGR